jgi:hypothetical protein
VVTALEHKKKALESFVQLHVTGYCGEPKNRAPAGPVKEAVENARVKAMTKPIVRR